MVTRVKISQKKAGACDVRHRCDGENVERKNPTHRIGARRLRTAPDFSDCGHNSARFRPLSFPLRRAVVAGAERKKADRRDTAARLLRGLARERKEPNPTRCRGTSIQRCRTRLETVSRVMRHSGEGDGVSNE